MKAQVFLSEDVESKDAAQEIASNIRESFGAEPDALIVEAGFDHQHDDVLSTLQQHFPKAAIVGGTTDGEVHQGDFHTDSLVVAAVSGGPKTPMAAVCLTDLTNDNLSDKMKMAVAEARRKLGDGIKLGFAWVEGLPGFDPGPSLELLYKHLGREIPIFGGSTGDYLRMKSTRQFFGGKALQQSIVFLFIAGEVEFAAAIDSGWVPIGEMRKITKAEANILKEIDGRPAADVIREYTGSLDNLCKNPFAIYESADEFYMLAGITQTPEGHILTAATVPVGKTVRFTEVTSERLIGAATTAVTDLRRRFTKKPSCLFVFSCSARRQLLGTAVGRELEPLVKQFPGVPVVGQYCYGEFGPYKNKTRSRLHNNTCIIVAVA